MLLRLPTVNTSQYIKILENYLVASASSLVTFDEYTFQENGDIAYNSKIKKKMDSG